MLILKINLEFTPISLNLLLLKFLQIIISFKTCKDEDYLVVFLIFTLILSGAAKDKISTPLITPGQRPSQAPKFNNSFFVIPEQGSLLEEVEFGILDSSHVRGERGQ